MVRKFHYLRFYSEGTVGYVNSVPGCQCHFECLTLYSHRLRSDSGSGGGRPGWPTHSSPFRDVERRGQRNRHFTSWLTSVKGGVVRYYSYVLLLDWSCLCVQRPRIYSLHRRDYFCTPLMRNVTDFYGRMSNPNPDKDYVLVFCTELYFSSNWRKEKSVERNLTSEVSHYFSFLSLTYRERF